MSEGGWNLLEQEMLCATPHLAVYRERVATPHQPAGVEWLTVTRKPGVVVVPRLADGRWLLIHEDRISPRRSFWSFPAGQIDDDSADGRETAERELIEETSHECLGEWHALGVMFTSPGFTDEKLHLWLAAGVKPLAHGGEPEAAIREIRAFTSAELRERLNAGEICDANTLSALTHLFSRDLF